MNLIKEIELFDMNPDRFLSSPVFDRGLVTHVDSFTSSQVFSLLISKF